MAMLSLRIDSLKQLDMNMILSLSFPPSLPGPCACSFRCAYAFENTCERTRGQSQVPVLSLGVSCLVF